MRTMLSNVAAVLRILDYLTTGDDENVLLAPYNT